MNTLERFFEYRKSLIDQYAKGDMTKSEYLQSSLDAVLSLGIKPFRNIDTVEKGLFNYQYYNAMAKAARIEGYDSRVDMLERVNYLYRKKDHATLVALELLEFRGVSAYFVSTRSKELKGKLIEIIIEKYDMILHSKSPRILERLREERIFDEGTRLSVIDGYVNQKY